MRRIVILLLLVLLPAAISRAADSRGGDRLPNVVIIFVDDMGYGDVTLKIASSLFDLNADPSEKIDVAADHPDVVKRLEAVAARAREDLGDSLMHAQGKNVREPGRLADPRGFRDQAGGTLPGQPRPDGEVHGGED